MDKKEPTETVLSDFADVPHLDWHSFASADESDVYPCWIWADGHPVDTDYSNCEDTADLGPSALKDMLCLHHLLISPAEVRTALLTGVRDFSDFYSSALPLLLNIFVQDDSLLWKDTLIKSYLSYATRVQRRYLAALCQYGVVSEEERQVFQEDISVDSILRRHESLCQFDASEPKRADYAILLEETSEPLGYAAADVERLKEAVADSRSTLKTLSEFCKLHSQAARDVKLKPTQLMGDFVAALGHLALGVIESRRKEGRLASADMQKTRLHLIRANLQIKEAALKAYWKYARPETIEKKLVLKFLQVGESNVLDIERRAADVQEIYDDCIIKPMHAGTVAGNEHQPKDNVKDKAYIIEALPIDLGTTSTTNAHPLRLAINPGNASAQEVAALLHLLEKVYTAAGGTGLNYTLLQPNPALESASV